MVTTVAPTMPVEAAKKAPTTTTETARPPGRGPNTRAIVVNRSLAILERSKVMPINTNIKTARSVSIDCPAKTRSLIRFTMKDTFRSSATSHPFEKTGTSMRGKSGYRKTLTVSALTPCPISAPNSADDLSIAWWINSPPLSKAAIMPKEMTAAPPMAKATGKPERIPPNRHKKTINRPISTPSNPKIIALAPNECLRPIRPLGRQVDLHRGICPQRLRPLSSPDMTGRKTRLLAK